MIRFRITEVKQVSQAAGKRVYFLQGFSAVVATALRAVLLNVANEESPQGRGSKLLRLFAQEMIRVGK